MRFAEVLPVLLLVLVLFFPITGPLHGSTAIVSHFRPESVQSGSQMYYVNHTMYLNGSRVINGSVNYYSEVPGPAAILYDGTSNTVYVASSLSSIYSINATTYSSSVSSSLGEFPASLSYIAKTNSLFFLPGQNNLSRWNLSSSAITNLSVGSYPQSLAYDSELNTMFVTVQGVDSLVAVNTTSYNVSYRLPLRFGPFGVMFNPDNGFIYLSYPDAGLVSVFNPVSKQFVSNITIGGSPYEFAMNNAANRVYVTNQGLNQVDLIDGSTQKFTGRVNVGDDPQGIAYSPSSGMLFVANTYSSNLTVIGTSSYQVRQNLHLGSQPYAVAVDSRSGSVFVGNHGSNSLSIVSPVRNNYVTFAEVGLPIGSVWHVTLNGAARYSDSSNLSFDQANGEFNYTISSVPGYYLTTSGHISVSGNSVVVVKYHSVAALHREIATIAVSVAVIGIVSGIWFIKRKK